MLVNVVNLLWLMWNNSGVCIRYVIIIFHNFDFAYKNQNFQRAFIPLQVERNFWATCFFRLNCPQERKKNQIVSGSPTRYFSSQAKFLLRESTSPNWPRFVSAANDFLHIFFRCFRKRFYYYRFMVPRERAEQKKKGKHCSELVSYVTVINLDRKSFANESEK